MKKIFLLWVSFVMIAGACYAAPIYGPNMPAKGKFFGGAQTHSVLERKLEGAHGEMASLQHFLLLSYGVTDWLSLDLKAGTGNIRQHPDAGEKLGYASRFAGGYGFRIKTYEKDKIKTLVGFQHISVHPWEDWSSGDKYQPIVDDWQVSALVSYAFSKITPYAGVKAGRMDYTYWVNEHDRNRVKSDETKMVGLVLGMDIAMNEKTWVNLEAQFLDGAAVVAGVNFKF